MQYGITLPGRGPLATPDNMAAIAQRAEALGYDSIALGDHILVPRSIDSAYPVHRDGGVPGFRFRPGHGTDNGAGLHGRLHPENPAGDLGAHRASPEPVGGSQGPGHTGRAVRGAV